MPRRSLDTREKDAKTRAFKDRWCPKCANYRPRKEFDPDAGRMGVSTYCNNCTKQREEAAAKRRAEYMAERAKIDARKAERHAQVLARIQDRHERSMARMAKRDELRLLDYARRRAAMYDLPCNLTVDDIVIPDKCPALGFPLVRSTGVQAKIKFNSPTIDRIVGKKGYVKGNINVISNRANLMKGTREISELKTFAKWILTL